MGTYTFINRFIRFRCFYYHHLQLRSLLVKGDKLYFSDHWPTKNTALQNNSFPFSQKLRNMTLSAK